MKKILFLTRNFPPLMTAGSDRAWKLAQHMREFGWEPVVVAPPDITGLGNDHMNVPDTREPKGMLIHRTGKDINAGVLDNSGKSALARGKSVSSLQSVKSRLSGIFSNDSGGAEWEKSAAQLVEQLLKDNPEIDMVYAQGPPINPLLLALDVARRHHLLLILDIIDPVDPTALEPGGMTTMQNNSARAEERILLSGVTLITPTRGLKEYFLKKYHGRLSNDNIAIVHNGYDRELQECRPPANKTPSAVRRWAFLLERVAKNDLKTLVKGLDAFVTAEGYLPGTAEFVFFGECGRDIAGHVKKSALGQLIEVRDCSTVCEELELCRSADVFCTVLGMDPLNNHYIPERLVDALGMNKPLFAIVPDGAARLLVQEANGITAPVTAAEEIKEQCRTVAGLLRNSSLPLVPEPVRKKYEIRQSLHELTREIATLLPP